MFFEYPGLLFLLIIPALLVARYIYLELSGRRAHLRVSSIKPWKSGGSSVLSVLRHAPFVLRTIALCLIIIAIARPRSSSKIDKIDTEGIDIVLAMDVSTSMLARDFKPDRISAAKDIAVEFIAQRPSDRMGIVVFAGEAYTQCPLTTDRATLINLMKEVETGLITDGTAIGNGLATAIARMSSSDAKSRVVILLTDGSNNRGDISPMTAAQIAKSLGIRVYTIGVGTNKVARYPMPVAGGVQYVNIPVEIDEKTLGDIAAITDGNYYRATSNNELKKIYQDIDKLEKTKMKVRKFSKRYEAYQPFALAAVVLLLLEILLRNTVLRKLP